MLLPANRQINKQADRQTPGITVPTSATSLAEVISRYIVHKILFTYNTVAVA